ncbi:MAG: tRNA (adenosine(37)-N6)-dimethylallyltransferase MiaA [bacterium]|nr:tRNA (adenosine(37)-N6)-dimethylallyltransferase MiaA [bacterium]
MKKKVLVIVGPTASGKSDLAVRLAKKFNGEIISADSRQVYKGLNVGTGKITKQEMMGVSHYLLDVANPKKQFSVADYKQLAEHNLRYIVSCGKLPIVAGGTGFYIDTLTGMINFPNVPPNKKLREKLSQKSTEVLFKMLETKDSRRARTIDPHNKIRLIRALEIIEALGYVPTRQPCRLTSFDFIYIGLKPNDLDKRIYKRLLQRLKPMIREGKRLHKQGLTYKRMRELGLEYRYIALYLQGKTLQKEMVEKLYAESGHYAKRQMTWFKRNKKIKWFILKSIEGFKPEEYKEIERYARRMLG